MTFSASLESLPSATPATTCEHPTQSVMYHGEIDDEGAEYEEFWCALCNRWLPPGSMQEIRERPDWNGGISDDAVLTSIPKETRSSTHE